MLGNHFAMLCEMCNVLGRNKADNFEDLVETQINFTANILQAWEQDVTKNALLAFSLRSFQAKFGRCERRCYHSGNGEELSRSMG